MSDRPFKPVYVLAGDDALLRDTHRQEIVQRVVGDADPQMCVRTLDEDAELADVLDELRTLPFLAPAKLVIVRNADDFVSKHREALENYVKSPGSSAALLLVVSSWRPSKLADLVRRVGEVRECHVDEHANLAALVTAAADKRGKKIDPDAAEQLAQWVGPDLARLDAEVEKLALFVGDRPRIGLDDVIQNVTDVAGPASYELSNALTAGDVKAALRALDKALVSSSDAFAILGSIAWHLRRVLAARQQVASGVPAAQAVRVPAAQKPAMVRLLGRRPLEKMQQDLREALAADLAIKTSADPAAVLEALVISLCS